MRALENCEPKRVFYYFEELCKIPHGSGNTKQISDYLVSFAKEHGLEYVQDEMNNVVIYKPATEGYEDAPARTFPENKVDFLLRIAYANSS